jgi:hypothetical protein
VLERPGLSWLWDHQVRGYLFLGMVFAVQAYKHGKGCFVLKQKKAHNNDAPHAYA